MTALRALAACISCVAAIGSPARPFKQFSFNVRRHPSVVVDEREVRNILSMASRVLNASCKEAGQLKIAKKLKKQWCELEFQLHGTLQLMTPLDQEILRRNHYSEERIRAIKISENSGLYGTDAVQAVIASGSREGFTINIVRNIVAPCPREFDSLIEEQRGFGSVRRKHTPNDAYRDMGCTHILGHTGVIQSPAADVKKDKEWLRAESVLWAHEIAHFLGLEDLEDTVVPRPPMESPGLLMMYPYAVDSTKLFPQECDVLMHYPDNQPQRSKLVELEHELSRKKKKSNPLPKPATRTGTNPSSTSLLAKHHRMAAAGDHSIAREPLGQVGITRDREPRIVTA